LKQCHILQGLNQELQKYSFTFFTPLTNKHCDRNFLTAVPINDDFMFLIAGDQVTSANGNLIVTVSQS